MTAWMTCSMMSARSWSLVRVLLGSLSENSACWVEMTTASTRTGLLLLSYSTVTCDLAVGAEVAELAVFADFGELVGELVGERDGRGHQLGGLVGGVAEHHALVAGAAGVDTLGDVGGLAVDGGDDGAGVAVEALEGVVVADLADRVADESLEVDVGLGGDLAGDDDEAGAGEGLAGDAAGGVLGEAGVEDGVGDLVGDLVGVTFGHGLTGEEETVGVGRQSGKLLRSDSRTRSGNAEHPTTGPSCCEVPRAWRQHWSPVVPPIRCESLQGEPFYSTCAEGAGRSGNSEWGETRGEG